jgi:hypothetical protein
MKPFLWPRILTIASIGGLGNLWLRHHQLETVNLGRAASLTLSGPQEIKQSR